MGTVHNVSGTACTQLYSLEVSAVTAGKSLLGVVEKVQAKVKDAARDGLAIDLEVVLVEVPSAGAVRG